MSFVAKGVTPLQVAARYSPWPNLATGQDVYAVGMVESHHSRFFLLTWHHSVCSAWSKNRAAAHGPQLTFGAPLALRILPANCGFPRVGLPGLEPGTSSLSEKRSNRLSYRP